MALRIDYFFRETAQGLKRNGLVAFAAIATVFISLFLVGGAVLIQREVNLVIEATTQNVEVAVYLTDPVTTDTVQHLEGILHSVPAVSNVTYQTKTQACAEFRRLFANQPALVENVSCDALPASLRVKLANPEQFRQVAAALGCSLDPSTGQLVCKQPGIERVADQRAILKRLFAIINVFRVSVAVVAVVMLLSAAALIANTIRIGLFARRKEIGIMKLVGATNWRIRIPFLIEGLVEALIGAGAAVAGLFAVKTLLVDPVRGTIGFLPLIQNGDLMAAIPWIIIPGVAVAIVAGLIAMRRFLDV